MSHLSFATRMQHVAIEVVNMEESIRFYQETLGMKLTEQHEAFEVEAIPVALSFLRLPQSQDHHDLVLVHDPNKDYTTKAEGTAPNFHHMAFLLPSRDVWLDQFNHLQQLGIEIVRGPVIHSPYQPGGEGSWGENESYYILDPNGHRIELYCNMATIDQEGYFRDATGSRIAEAQAVEV